MVSKSYGLELSKLRMVKKLSQMSKNRLKLSKIFKWKCWCIRGSKGGLFTELECVINVYINGAEVNGWGKAACSDAFWGVKWPQRPITDFHGVQYHHRGLFFQGKSLKLCVHIAKWVKYPQAKTFLNVKGISREVREKTRKLVQVRRSREKKT